MEPEHRRSAFSHRAAFGLGRAAWEAPRAHSRRCPRSARSACSSGSCCDVASATRKIPKNRLKNRYSHAMNFSGRSPFNDVVRSVIIGAAMISPAAMVACAESPPPPPANPDAPLPVATGGSDVPVAPTATAPTGGAYASINDSGTPAPPDTVVRPRTPPGQQNFPTRGFSGAARARV
jgi:hypothetical protein